MYVSLKKQPIHYLTLFVSRSSVYFRGGSSSSTKSVFGERDGAVIVDLSSRLGGSTEVKGSLALPCMSPLRGRANGEPMLCQSGLEFEHHYFHCAGPESGC